MEWAYIQIATIVIIVAALIYIGVADNKLNKEHQH